MTARFRLHDGHRVDVGHARQQAVLAVLLVEVNRSVAVDHLVERVWADRPPYRPRNALSAYLSRLRLLLAGLPGLRIGRGPAGYVLATDALAVDLHEFRHLVGRARAADPPAEAAALYGRALGLWRGESLARPPMPGMRPV